MLAKVFACSLLVLILSPFTAPFSTCDLASPVTPSPLTHRGGRGWPFAPRRAATAVAVDSTTVLVTARVIAGRGHLVPLVGPRLELLGPVGLDRAGRLGDSATPIRTSGARLTILRL